MGRENELLSNPDLLYQFFRIACGVEFCRERVCHDYGDPEDKDSKNAMRHVSPFDIAWQHYSGQTQNSIDMCSRTWGKTLLFSTLNVANFTTKPYFGTASAGAVLEQAEEGYGYFKDIVMGNNVFREMTSKLTKKESKTDSLGSRVSIIVSSKNGFNCKHPNLLIIDEFELLPSYNILNQAVFMPKEDKIRKYLPQLVYVSSLKSPNGMMVKFLKDKNFKKRNFKSFVSCVFEVAEKCTPDRSCSRCVLLDDCKGILKKKKENGHMTIDNIIFYKMNASKEEYIMQTLCRKLKPIDTVYGREFDRAIHVLPETYTYNPNLETVGGADFGEGGDERDNNIRLAAQVDYENNRVFVFKEKRNNGASGGATPSSLAAEDKEWTNRYRITKWFVDPRGGTYIAEMLAAGLNVITMLSLTDQYKELYGQEIEYNSQGFVMDGIISVRRLLQTANGVTSLYICPSCERLIDDLESNYVWPKKLINGEPTYSDKPDKKCSHGPDALRYMISNLFPYFNLGSVSRVGTYDDYTPIKGVLPEERTNQYVDQMLGDNFFMASELEKSVVSPSLGDTFDFGGF